MRRSAWTIAVAIVLALTVLAAFPAAEAAKKPPKKAGATDHGFPLDQYFRGVLRGKLFIGGDPPAIIGAKTKDTVFVVDGKAHYQPQLALRRAGRDDGKGRFLVLRARSWGSALAYVIKLDPGIVKFFRVAFPAAIGGTKFPPLHATVTYGFEVAPASDSPSYAKASVASEPHPDPALRPTRRSRASWTRGSSC